MPLGCAASSSLVVELVLDEEDEEGGLRFLFVAVVVFGGAAFDFDTVCSGLRVCVVFFVGIPLVLSQPPGLVCFSVAALFAAAASSWRF